MKYVVIKLQGHQYKVSENEEFLVDKLGDNKPEPKILLFVDGQKVELGNPYLDSHQVKLKILDHKRGKKVDIRKYKAKSRYRKSIGFRPQYTLLKVENIS